MFLIPYEIELILDKVDGDDVTLLTKEDYDALQTFILEQGMYHDEDAYMKACCAMELYKEYNV